MMRLAFEDWTPPTDEDRREALSGSDLLIMWQDGRCAICGGRDRLVLDHDHSTALIRGWLCSGCNTTEGMSSNPEYVAYRMNHPAKALGIEERYPDAEPYVPCTMEEKRAAMDALDAYLNMG